MEMDETLPKEGRHSHWSGAVWDDEEQCGCNGLVDMRHIRCFTVRQGQLHIICWQPVPWPLIIDNKLTPKRVTALLLGSGHHVHAMLFKFHDDSLRGWALDDEGDNHIHSRAEPTLDFLTSRAVAFPLYPEEYVTRVTGDYSTVVKIPVHSMVIYLSFNRILTVSGSNKREMAMEKFDSRRANESHFEELSYTELKMPMQICNTYFTTGRRISVT